MTVQLAARQPEWVARTPAFAGAGKPGHDRGGGALNLIPVIPRLVRGTQAVTFELAARQPEWVARTSRAMTDI